jgi:hypothetical protein
MRASLFQPALLAGIVIGVLSALPIVSAGNCCCCMWVIGGGALAAWLLQQNSSRAITVAEGMLAGMAAGIVGAVVAVPISLASQALLGGLGMERDFLNRVLESAQSMPPEVRDALERARSSSLSASGGVLRVLLLLVFSLAVNLVFATLGGLVGALFFRKGPETSNWGPPAEPPPPPPPVPPSTI